MDAGKLASAGRDDFDRFCRGVATGELKPVPVLERELSARVGGASDMAAAAAASGRLAEYRRAEVAALERMTPEERLMRYRKGQLTVRQGWAWWQRRREEVPTVDGQPEWLARTLCEVADSRSPGHRSVGRSERSAAVPRRVEGRVLE